MRSISMETHQIYSHLHYFLHSRNISNTEEMQNSFNRAKNLVAEYHPAATVLHIYLKDKRNDCDV